MGRFDKDVNVKLAGITEAMVVKITGEVSEGSSSESAAKTAVKDTKPSVAAETKTVTKTTTTKTKVKNSKKVS
jgi:hypothetical protein